MALMTTYAYTPTPPAGVTTEQWSSVLDGVNIRGIRTRPTTPGAKLQRGILFVPGGKGIADVAMNDGDIDELEYYPQFFDPDQEDPAPAGFCLVGVAPRESAINIWTGKPVTLGSDDFGGANSIEDVALAWSVMMEWGLTTTHLVHPFKNAAIGHSAGAMRLLVAMRAGRINPAACIIRAPFVNIYDWDSLTGDRTQIASAMGFTSPPTTTFENLTNPEKQKLKDRSPLMWPEELPKVPYLILEAESDAVVPKAWTRGFEAQMRHAGHDVTLLTCPTASHGFPTSDEYLWAITMGRKFMAKHLA